MPKLKPSDLELANRETRSVIVSNMALYDITEDDLAKRLSCTVRTIQNKINRPQTITWMEMRILIKFLKITNDQLPRLIGGIGG